MTPASLDAATEEEDEESRASFASTEESLNAGTADEYAVEINSASLDAAPEDDSSAVS